MANKHRRKEGNPSRGVSTLAKTTSFGVCTRAKSIAMKGSMANVDNEGDACYLHLRSRRLLRCPPPFVKRAMKNKCGYKKKGFNHDEKENLGENDGENSSMVEKEEMEEKDGYGERAQDSFVENNLIFDSGSERVNTRESSFIMGRSEISTPTSSNKATVNKQINSAEDLEESFAAAQKQAIDEFIQKYNFDVRNDKPCKGRFEWVKIKP